MDEDNSSIPETHKLGIRVSHMSAPVPDVEPDFSVRSETGSLTSTALRSLSDDAEMVHTRVLRYFSEPQPAKVGNTRPKQHPIYFAGGSSERAYLTFFLTGDMFSYRHGTKIRVEGGTTHPSQLALLLSAFGDYAKPMFVPTKTPSGQHGFRAAFDLHSSFDFLLNKSQRVDGRILDDDLLFYSALSGFADAEGHVGLRKSGTKSYSCFTLSNRNHEIMEDFQRGLRQRGHRPSLSPLLTKQKIQWQLELVGRSCLDLLPKVAFRHTEKIIGAELAFEFDAKPWTVAEPAYSMLKREIGRGRDELCKYAELRYNLRSSRKEQRKKAWESKVESAFPLFTGGLSMTEVAQALNCSIRTAYRRKQKYLENHYME